MNFKYLHIVSFLNVTIFTLMVSGVLVAQPYPHTDPTNQGNWILLGNMSDEFSGTQPDGTGVDENKWLVQGRNGEYRSNFVGRGYSTALGDNWDTGWQFSPGNVRVDGGFLKITTKYEPDYDWKPQSRDFPDPSVYPFQYTTGGISSKQTFNQGYMEIRCRLPNAYTTGAFWTTGSGAELDVFEGVGIGQRDNKLWSSIHDWYYGSNPNNAWTQTKDISPDFDFSEGFHIVAAEWDNQGVKIYVDGVLHYDVKKTDVESGVYLNPPYVPSTRWPLTAGQHIWADSEIFPWWGVPGINTPDVEYVVDYIRVWQRAPNQAPRFTSDPVSSSATEGMPISGSLAANATDPEGDALTFSKVSGPGWLSVAEDGTLSGTPGMGNVGTNAFTVQVSDYDKQDTATLHVSIQPGPLSTYISTYNLSGSKADDKDGDSDNDWYEYVFGGNPGSSSMLAVRPFINPQTFNFHFSLRNDTFLAAHVRTSSTLAPEHWTTHQTVIPALNDGSVQEYLVVLPSVGDSLFVIVDVVDRTPVNQPPVFTSSLIYRPEAAVNETYNSSIAGEATDPEGDPFTYVKASGPAWLSVSNNGALSGTPASGDNGLNTFHVQAVDAAGGATTAQLEIQVSSYTQLYFDFFDFGIGNWDDSDDFVQLINSTPYAYSGTSAVRITRTGIMPLVPTLNLVGKSRVKVELTYVYEGAGSGEGISLQFRASSASPWETVAEFLNPSFSSNGTRYFGNAIIDSSAYLFGPAAELRFTSQGNWNGDRCYADDIVISFQ
ncbi:MAG: putative Ig domain-containing protein [Puniceicoccaceae bacterium]